MNKLDDEIIEIEYLGEKDTIDISVSGNRLFYANGILTHNSSVEEVDFNHSMIAGGISKINTADNLFGIFTSRSMREAGRYQLQLMKTRSSSGVGSKIDLEFDVNSLRITGLTEEQQQQASPNNPSSVIDKIRARSEVKKLDLDADPAAETKHSVKADVQGSKLKAMLADLKSSKGK